MGSLLTFTLREGKILWCFLLLQMLIITLTVPVNASSATVVKVEPHSSTASVGESFTVNITVTDVQNLFGLEVTLYWNKSVLDISGVDVRLGIETHPDGVLHEPLFIAKNETIQGEGKYQLIATSTGQTTSSFNGGGNIARIIFKVINVGSSELNLGTKLASKPPPSGVSSPIDHTTIDGFFGPQAPEQPPSIWPYIIILVVIIAALIGAIVIYRKRAKKR